MSNRFSYTNEATCSNGTTLNASLSQAIQPPNGWCVIARWNSGREQDALRGRAARTIAAALAHPGNIGLRMGTALAAGTHQFWMLGGLNTDSSPSNQPESPNVDGYHRAAVGIYR